MMGGTLPWNAGRIGTMPRSRIRLKILICSACCAAIHDLDNAIPSGIPTPPEPTPCIDWPRDHANQAGPFVQFPCVRLRKATPHTRTPTRTHTYSQQNPSAMRGCTTVPPPPPPPPPPLISLFLKCVLHSCKGKTLSENAHYHPSASTTYKGCVVHTKM